MTRPRPPLFAPLALLVSFATVSAAPSSTPADAVAKSILVTVLDEAGEPLRDLAAPDFIITEDGARREVIDARPNNEPLFVALLVDTARPVLASQFPTLELRRGLSAFGRRILVGSPGSHISIFDIAMGGSVVVPFTPDLGRFTAWTERVVASQQGAGVLLEAMAEASRQLMGKNSPRRVIVSVTFDAAESSAVTPQAVAEAVIKSGAAYWPVSIRGTGLNHRSVPLREVLFSVLPEPTGGLRVGGVSTQSLESMLDRVASALTWQYEVTYARPDDAVPKDIQAGARRGAKVLRGSWIR